ncbi:SDR family NAD(P)-dependent oxidoreductase [Pseudarthrobacter sp. AG30]|uniref:SDR family NAD(P)-dependent oxidoreductase n=1 Tax=Pseudarthrobacter sp. AG30 TaxID=2249742 RepID=UPI000D6E44C2|nr:SDR family NAD(P)-dependent oxidoreductase [Pseudarthrobacter sp. AG30]RAX14757.1 SDR family NAD(P)-dependent oxidoreductase [Pseudarthrobacter sp. AG30]
MNNSRYSEQVVLVTGGAQGLGRAMVERFSDEGATVHFADLNDAAAQDVTDSRPNGSTIYDRVDITDPAAAKDWIDGIANKRGRIDVLVNNAGIIRDNRIENISPEDWNAVLSVNLTGAFNCTQAAFAHMKDRGYGRVLSFSSMSWRGNFGQVNYVAAKAGVVGFTRGFALEGARHGVTANAIAPGLIETPMLASMNAPARDKLVAKVPLRNTGKPEDIAAAAAFLCSPEARYITGVVLDVDGGIGIGSSIR